MSHKPKVLAVSDGGTGVAALSTNGIIYATGSTAFGQITPVNSAVVVTDGSGVPSQSTTLPSGLAATNLTLTTPTLGVASGTSLTLTSQPRCSVYRTAVQNINSAAATAISFPTGSATELFDVGAMHDLTTNPTRLTVPASQGGLYLIGAALRFDPAAAGVRSIYFNINGSTSYSQVVNAVNSATSGTYLATSTILTLSAADYIELIALQTSGAGMDLGGTDQTTSSFWAVRLM